MDENPTNLPPLKQLEPFLLESTDNFIHLLPLIQEQITKYLQQYPDQLQFTVDTFKPLLKDMRKRFMLRMGHTVKDAPICKVVPYEWENCHGEVIHDNYAWLTDKDDPEVLAYLDAENSYAESQLAHTKTLQKVLYKEAVSRLDENEESCKVQLPDGWMYYTRKTPGAEYRLHVRLDKNGYEEVYLDENTLCEGYFHLGFLRHSQDCQIVAYGIDNNGSERYMTYFKNLETHEMLEDVIPDCYEEFEFGMDRECYYVKIDEYERAYQLRRYFLGSKEDTVLYEEKDEMFCLQMTKSCNKRFIILNTAAQATSETHFVDLQQKTGGVNLVFARKEWVQYSIEFHNFEDAEKDSQDYHGYIYFLTNESSKNMQLYRVPFVQDYEKRFGSKGMDIEWVAQNRETVVEHRDFVLIEAFSVRCRHLIVFERSNCLQNIRIVNMEVGGGFDTFHYVPFPDGLIYSIFPGSVDEEVADLSKSTLFDTNCLRFTYTSFVQPKQVIDYNMNTRARVVVHEERVFGPAYNKDYYMQKRVWATGVDGTAIPISLVYRKDLIKISPNNWSTANTYGDPSVDDIAESGVSVGNPLLLHGYGAYGYCIHPTFSSSRLSLLDRGFIYAVAHVRGGSDMGNSWYEEGKLAKKPNTFHDFISCAEYLIKEGYTSKEQLAIYGRSAGGLLIGAVVNMRPDLFKAVLTEVPFVDVINTMFDTSIPWTAFEFSEWGSPEEKNIYEIMKGYCPYTNVLPDQIYPHMLVVAGMNDPRVAYFEPAKWTAKLRALGNWSKAKNSSQNQVGAEPSPTEDQPISDRVLLLKIQDAGHSGSSGQYAYLEDMAFEYAYLISSLNASFRPQNCGGTSLSGVDYEQYWNELGNEDMDDDEDYEEEEKSKPGTPLQRFQTFWRRMSEQRKPKKEKSRQGSQRHSRSSSLLKGLGLIRNKDSRNTVSVPEEDETPQLTPTDTQDGTADSVAVTVDNEDAKEAADNVPEPVPLQHKEVGSGPRPGNNQTPGGSKTSLRQQMYHEETGRVQSSGKMYNFLSKFF